MVLQRRLTAVELNGDEIAALRSHATVPTSPSPAGPVDRFVYEIAFSEGDRRCTVILSEADLDERSQALVDRLSALARDVSR